MPVFSAFHTRWLSNSRRSSPAHRVKYNYIYQGRILLLISNQFRGATLSIPRLPYNSKDNIRDNKLPPDKTNPYTQHTPAEGYPLSKLTSPPASLACISRTRIYGHEARAARAYTAINIKIMACRSQSRCAARSAPSHRGGEARLRSHGSSAC